MYRLMFIAENGVQTVNGTATVEHGDDLDLTTVLAKAIAYVDSQWPGSDRKYYRSHYNRAKRQLKRFAKGDQTHCLLSVEYGWLFITS